MSEEQSENLGSSGEGLSDAERMMRYDANKKSALLAYVIWFFLAGLAGHRFYLRRYRSAVIMLLLWLAGVLLIVFSLVAARTSEAGDAVRSLAVFAPVVLAIPAIWVVVDLFLIPGMVRKFNHGIIDRLQQ